MKKSIVAVSLVFLLLITCFAGCGDNSQSASGNKGTGTGNAGSVKLNRSINIVKSKYDDGLESGVISYDAVKDYGADNTGKEDATQAILEALFQAQVDGGGTVYLPEGKYLVTDVISVPSNVVLRGEWQSPAKENAGSKGTVLIADNDEVFKIDPVVFLNESSGIQNITVIYPNQSVKAPIEYYYAVEIGYYRCFTMENVTVLGAWNGIALGNTGQGNEIYYLKNVYVSALNIGIYNVNTSDTGRMEHVFVSPEYWTENTLYPMDKGDKQKTRDYFRAHARGFEFYRNDWSVSYDIEIKDLSIGMYFGLYEGSTAMNGKFMNVTIKNCDTGIYLQRTKLAGVDFTNLTITTDWASKAAIDSSTEQDGTCMFYNTEITGPFKTPVQNNGQGQSSTSGSYNFVLGKISGYDAENTYAVTLNGGSITMQEFEFGEAKHHIRVSDKIQSLQLLGCKFGGTADISVPDISKANCYIDNGSANNYHLKNTEYNYIERIPSVKSDKLVNVCDYGADKESDDNTEAFQKALDSLRGVGGTVYVPAGNWQLKKELVVPSGVELRGCTPVQQIQSRDCITGTVLWIYSGKGNEKGTPFITLEEGSGVRGFCAYYPEQNIDGETVEYPWTVRAAGKNCWAEDISLTNSYNGMDFGTYKTDGFYIDFVAGSPIRRGIFVGNAKEGWLQNCQFNPNYAYVNSVNSGNKDYRLYYCDAYIVGHVEKLNSLNLFEYGCKNGMLFIDQESKGSNGAIINLGIDGTGTSVHIMKAGEIEFVNPQLVAMASINYKTNILTDETFNGNAAFVNSTIWGPTNTLVNVGGGTVNVNLMNIATGFGDYSIHTTGGRLNMASTIFHNLKTLIEKNTEQVSLYGCYTRVYKNKITLNNTGKATVENAHAWWS